MTPRSLILLLAGLMLAGCSKNEKTAEAASTKEPEPLEIRSAVVETRKMDKSISVTGALHPDETVSVSAEVPGRVSSILVDFGQNVRRGQIIAELDKQELNLSLERSKAALAQVLARLGLDASQENVRPESTPSIRQAIAQMEDAKSKYDNASRLVKTGDISQERFTEIEKVYQSRQAALDAARDEARTLIANVQALRAEVKLAQKRLNDATVRAPFDGAVQEKLVSAGAYLKENTPILTLMKANPVRLRVDLPESAAGSVHVGTNLTFRTDAAPGDTFTATVRAVESVLGSKVKDADGGSSTGSQRLAVAARNVRASAACRPKRRSDDYGS